MTVANCFRRIQEHLLENERTDDRLTPASFNSGQINDQASKAFDPPSSFVNSNAFDIVADSVSWRHASDDSPSEEKKPVSHNRFLCIPHGSITMIVGPVGCGKSTLLKLLLGEIPFASGSLYTRHTSAAYCSQSPWVTFGTIQENIVGASPWDRSWYDTVIQACALDIDFQDLPDRDLTRVGARGSRLSGGQQMRVVSKWPFFDYLRLRSYVLVSGKSSLFETRASHS